MRTPSSPLMRYAMCGGQELRTVSSDYATMILARNEILNDVIDQLLTTAVTRCEYSRSIAYVVVLISNTFHKNSKGNPAKEFVHKFCDGAISEFENFNWKNASEDDNEVESRCFSINALALSAFIGDLTSLRLISYHRFKSLTRPLIGKMELCAHVEYVHTLISHATARLTPEMAPPFLYECIRTVRRQTNSCIVPRIHRFPEETTNFEDFVRQHLINRTALEFPSYHDLNLNLEDALMASVCVRPPHV